MEPGCVSVDFLSQPSGSFSRGGARVKAHLVPQEWAGRLRSARIGRFWFVDGCTLPDGRFTGLTSKEKSHLRFMCDFYSSEKGLNLLRDVIVPANNEDRRVPALRKYNFSVTNTFKALSLTMIKDGVLRTPHEDYTSHLRAWTRDLYDSFRRGERVWFEVNGKKQYSTVAQLHFFMVGEETGQNEAVVKHEAVVEMHSQMQQKADRLRQKNKKKGDGQAPVAPGTGRRRCLTASAKTPIRVFCDEGNVVSKF